MAKWMTVIFCYVAVGCRHQLFGTSNQSRVSRGAHCHMVFRSSITAPRQDTTQWFMTGLCFRPNRWNRTGSSRGFGLLGIWGFQSQHLLPWPRCTCTTQLNLKCKLLSLATIGVTWPTGCAVPKYQRCRYVECTLGGILLTSPCTFYGHSVHFKKHYIVMFIW